VDRFFSEMPEPDRSRKLYRYPSRDLAHPLELKPFVVDGNAVSNDRGAKAALRAARQPFRGTKRLASVMRRWGLPAAPFAAAWAPQGNGTLARWRPL